MAPATPTFRKPRLQPERGTLLSFFKKETTSVRTGFDVSHTQVESGVVSVEHTVGPSKDSQARNTSSKQNSIHKGKGKEKQKDHNGSVHDPVVISDDDEDDVLPAAPPTRSKRRKFSASSNRNQAPQLPSQSPCRPSEAPPMFASYSEFKPPPTWPQVVNTADVEENGNDQSMMVADEDDTRTPDPWEGKIEEDDSGVELDDRDRPHSPERQDTQSANGLTVGGIEWEEPDEGMGMEDEVDDADDVQSAISSSIKPSTSKRGRRISPFSFSIPIPEPPSQSTIKGPNAFSLLMSGHKEHEQWKDAEDDLRRDGKRYAGRRRAPFYKVLTGMPVAVDAFRYGAIPGVTAYLLTYVISINFTRVLADRNTGMPILIITPIFPKAGITGPSTVLRRQQTLSFICWKSIRNGL